MHCARLALVLHVVLCVESGIAPITPIDEKTMRDAITLTEWFLNEAHRIYAMLAAGVESVDREAESIIEKIRNHDGKMTATDLQNTMSKNSPFRCMDTLTKKLLEVVSTGKLIRLFEKAKNGRSVEYFCIP